MGKFKEKDLITKGLSSEVYLLAFLETSSGYAIARKLQKSEKPIDKSKPPTNWSKVDKALTDLARNGYLKHDFEKKRHFPILSTLIEDMNYILEEKGNSFDQVELKLLGFILKRRDVLNEISKDVLLQMKVQKKGVHKINALSVFSNKIGMLSASFLFAKENRPDYIKMFKEIPSIQIKQVEEIFLELDEGWDEVNGNIDSLFEEKFKKYSLPPEIEGLFRQTKGFWKSMPSLLVLLMASNETLRKLSLLWDQFDGFKLGVDLAMHAGKKLNKLL